MRHSKLEQAARQALVALEDVMTDFDGSWVLADTAITALREALAERHKENCACEVCRGCDNADIKDQQAEQEQNTITFRNDVQNTWVMRITADRRIEVNEGIEVTEAAKLVLTALEPMLRYAAPVRTKDLTDDEIGKLICQNSYMEDSYTHAEAFARSVIAADRSKNK